MKFIQLLSERREWWVLSTIFTGLLAILVGTVAWSAAPGEAGLPYPDMPRIAPPGVQIDHYLPVPEASRGPAVDPAKGYRTQNLGRGLYFVTDNMFQSLFLVYESGVIVMDAPPSYASHLSQAIAAVTSLPITHLIYSHSHIDHIGGASLLPGHPIIIAQRETKRLPCALVHRFLNYPIGAMVTHRATSTSMHRPNRC